MVVVVVPVTVALDTFAYVRRVHASRGKAIRAEPIALLYQRGADCAASATRASW